MKEVDSLRTVVSDCYSEYLLSGAKGKGQDGNEADTRQPPDAGLGLIFRYPGDARKLRDRSKMRLWGEYFRGKKTFFFDCIFRHVTDILQKMVGMLLWFANQPSTS